jgi:hypothetical protein
MLIQMATNISRDKFGYIFFYKNHFKSNYTRADSYHLVVNNPSTPTGPRAWILLVLIPTYSANKNQLWEAWISQMMLIIIERWHLPLHLIQIEPHHRILCLHCEKQQHCKCKEQETSLSWMLSLMHLHTCEKIESSRKN